MFCFTEGFLATTITGKQNNLQSEMADTQHNCYISIYVRPKKATGFPLTVLCLLTNALKDDTQLPMKKVAFVIIAMSIIGSSASLSPFRM